MPLDSILEDQLRYVWRKEQKFRRKRFDVTRDPVCSFHVTRKLDDRRRPFDKNSKPFIVGIPFSHWLREPQYRRALRARNNLSNPLRSPWRIEPEPAGSCVKL